MATVAWSSSIGNSSYVLHEHDTQDINWIIDLGATDHMTYSKKDMARDSKPRRT